MTLPKKYLWDAPPGTFVSGGHRPHDPHPARTPLFSIIVATYNSAATIKEAIDSVLSQRDAAFELLIIDGASTDATIEVVKSFGDRIDYWISEKDRGIYDAWNKGVLLARGDYLCFLGSDDVYVPGALARYAAYIREHPGVEYVSSRVQLHGGGKDLGIVGKPWAWNRFRRYMNVAHAGSAQASALYDKYGLYNTDFRIAGDYEFLLRAKDTLAAGYFDDVTARMSAGGVSRSQVDRVLRETRAAKLINSAASPLACRLEYYWAHLKQWPKRWLGA